MPEESLILAPPAPVEKIKLSPEAEQMMEVALSGAALIGKVTNADENAAAAAAQMELKRVVNLFEKSGEEVRAPHTKFNKDVIAFVKEHIADASRELDRVSTSIATFHQLEMAKQRAAENAARLERERIESERLAEERRVREEAAAAQRTLDEEAESARVKARDAAEQVAAARTALKLSETNPDVDIQSIKATLETSQSALQEAASLGREIERQKALATAANHDAMDAIQEKFNNQAAEISAPVRENVRAEGQRIATDWEITSINIHVLAKARPDLIRTIEFDKRMMKAELARGIKLPGVEAKEVVNAGISTRERKAIEA